MSQRLLFPDPATVSDVLVFAGRAVSLGDGSVRLQARDGAMALTSAPLAPRTLLESTPTVVGMRVVRTDPELVCDLVVDASTLQASDDPLAITLPDVAVTAPWAGVSPPRAGWSEVGALPAATLAARAQWGIAAVAEAVPKDAGDDAVHAVRSAVWGEADDELTGLPRGAAFAAFALGFIAGEEDAVIRRAGPWTRLSLARGHVLVRQTVRSGLTAVRTTGAV
ncbi:hypothetical protein [Microbacterium sp. bgisy203]|uniref:hypothetical protein n=1 Tax=Microbacterium sp. bgisy203 TaxID=3413799 RepID=UPI003D70C152